MHLDAALVSAVCGAVGGLLVPTLIGLVPEPKPRSEPPPDDQRENELDDRTEDRLEDQSDAPPKEPYADIAALPGLAWKSARWAWSGRW